MRIAIWGAGAVGLGLASTLARRGERLLLLGRDAATRAEIAREGIRRSGLFGERHVAADQLMIDHKPEALIDFAPDFLLICTKTCDTKDLAASLAPLSTELPLGMKLLLCQNGWGNETPFLSHWANNRLFRASIITGFHRRSLANVEITAHAAAISLGSVFGVDESALAPLALRISNGGVPAKIEHDMLSVVWSKMLYNCALNPLGALTNRRYGELTTESGTRAIVESVIHEIFGVLAARGVSLPWQDAASYLEKFHTELIPPTAAHESSMLQDLRAGRPTEIEALCGAVERLAEEAGLKTPINSALATLVREAESKEASSAG